jgi:hypothetical protein
MKERVLSHSAEIRSGESGDFGDFGKCGESTVVIGCFNET